MSELQMTVIKPAHPEYGLARSVMLSVREVPPGTMAAWRADRLADHAKWQSRDSSIPDLGEDWFKYNVSELGASEYLHSFAWYAVDGSRPES